MSDDEKRKNKDARAAASRIISSRNKEADINFKMVRKLNELGGHFANLPLALGMGQFLQAAVQDEKQRAKMTKAGEALLDRMLAQQGDDCLLARVSCKDAPEISEQLRQAGLRYAGKRNGYIEYRSQSSDMVAIAEILNGLDHQLIELKRPEPTENPTEDAQPSSEAPADLASTATEAATELRNLENLADKDPALAAGSEAVTSPGNETGPAGLNGETSEAAASTDQVTPEAVDPTAAQTAKDATATPAQDEGTPVPAEPNPQSVRHETVTANNSARNPSPGSTGTPQSMLASLKAGSSLPKTPAWPGGVRFSPARTGETVSTHTGGDTRSLVAPPPLEE